MIRKKGLLSWSSGKDSAWALHQLLSRKDLEVVGLFTVINETYQRVALHAIHVDLLKLQAEAVHLPLKIISIPHSCDHDTYAAIMKHFINQVQEEKIEWMAFGDLFLKDVRTYREEQLRESGISPLFPLWEIPTHELAERMIREGLAAYVTCVDPKMLSPTFVGRAYDAAFLADLPLHVDPCGENGEFHTFVFNGPMFHKPLSIQLGEIVERQGFVFADIIPMK